MYQEHINFNGLRNGLTLRRNNLASKGKFPSKADTNMDTYFGCSCWGHIIIKYPSSKKVKQLKSLKQSRKSWLQHAVIVSDNSESESKSEEKEMTNLFCMAKRELRKKKMKLLKR